MRNGSHRFWLFIAAAVAVAVIAVPAASAGIVKYNTHLTVTKDRGGNYHGKVRSDSDHNPGWGGDAVRKCMEGRLVILFKLRPGADRRLGAARSDRHGYWKLWQNRDYGERVRAKVKPKVRDRFVCRADRAAFRY